MAGVVNLRQARKAKQRKGDRAAADENAARFGRSKAQKAREVARNRSDNAHLDAHRRDGEPE